MKLVDCAIKIGVVVPAIDGVKYYTVRPQDSA